jgi:hypothetical protein
MTDNGLDYEDDNVDDLIKNGDKGDTPLVDLMIYERREAVKMKPPQGLGVLHLESRSIRQH